MFLRDGVEVPAPDPAAGLYIRNRQQAVVQACIPADHLAFQMGEASQVQGHRTELRLRSFSLSSGRGTDVGCADGNESRR